MEKRLLIIFVFVLGLSNLYLAYQIIDLQVTVTELYEIVYENRAVLELLKLFGVGV
jgi:hypothetical protein